MLGPPALPCGRGLPAELIRFLSPRFMQGVLGRGASECSVPRRTAVVGRPTTSVGRGLGVLEVRLAALGAEAAPYTARA